MTENLELKTYEALDKITSDDKLHLRFLETLSYLENVGAHKIMAYQTPSEASLEVLQHAHEETRHAWFFKKLTCHFDPQIIESKKLLGLPFSKHYLNLLDLKVVRELKKSFSNPLEWVKESSYFLTTYIIELRASHIYNIYENFLREKKFNFTLKSVLKEEASHLKEMQTELDKRPELFELSKNLEAWEEKQYLKLLNFFSKEY